MHEYSIVQALLERADSEASQREASAVVRLEVSIGALAGVEIELLRAAFEMARTGTRASDAELVVRDVPALWRCRSCRREITAGGILRCPSCGSSAELVAGDEIVLERMGMEVA